MGLRLFPKLRAPDWEYWKRCFPNGLGRSAFSSPAWQRLMLREVGSSWRLFFLRVGAANAHPLSLPVLVKTNTWRRFEITVRPIAYYVTPIEAAPTSCLEVMPSIVEAAGTPFTAGVTLWLPPWCPWRAPASTDGGCLACNKAHDSPWCSLQGRDFARQRWTGTLMRSSVATYLITLRGSAQDYLAGHVKRTQRQHLRASERAGLEVISSPSPDQVDEYCRLYSDVWDDREWTGPKLSSGFFHGVATELGDGGELLVMRHQGRVVGGGVLLYDRYAVHIFQATTDRHAGNVYANALLYMKAIEGADSRGLRYVNVGGVNRGNEGLIRFKESWGARAAPAAVISWRSGRRHLARYLGSRRRGAAAPSPDHRSCGTPPP